MIDYNTTELPSTQTEYTNRCRKYLLPALNLLKSVKAFEALHKKIMTVTTKDSRRIAYIY